jgi:hypothetical protein
MLWSCRFCTCRFREGGAGTPHGLRADRTAFDQFENTSMVPPRHWRPTGSGDGCRCFFCFTFNGALQQAANRSASKDMLIDINRSVRFGRVAAEEMKAG